MRTRICSRGVGVVVLALVVLALYIATRPHGCRFRSGLDRDLCYLRYFSAHDASACDVILDSVARDLCSRDRTFAARLVQLWLEPHVPDPCASIGNPFLEYECMRTAFRPHMLYFFPDPPIGRSQPRSYDALGEYRASMALSLEAARLAGSNLTGAEHLCSQLPEGGGRGECSFLVASASVIGAVPGPGDALGVQIDSIMSLCSRISDAQWRSECFYVLADELSLRRPEASIEGIARACAESTKAIDYQCYGHVVRFLPQSQRVSFCAGIPEIQKAGCYSALSATFAGDEHFDPSRMEGSCARVPQEFRNQCYVGYAAALGAEITDLPRRNVKICAAFMGEPRQQCFFEFGLAVASRFQDDACRAVRECGQFPEDEKDSCFWSVGFVLGKRKGEGTSLSGELCGIVPSEFRVSCVRGFSLSIAKRSVNADDIAAGIRQCQRLSGISFEDCLSDLARAVVEYSGADIPLMAARCDSFPTTHRQQCFSAVIDDIHRRSLYESSAMEDCDKLSPDFRSQCLVPQ